MSTYILSMLKMGAQGLTFWAVVSIWLKLAKNKLILIKIQKMDYKEIAFSGVFKVKLLSRQLLSMFLGAQINNNLKQGNKNIGKAGAFPNILFALFQVIKKLSTWILHYFLPAKMFCLVYTWKSTFAKVDFQLYFDKSIWWGL